VFPPRSEKLATTGAAQHTRRAATSGVLEAKAESCAGGCREQSGTKAESLFIRGEIQDEAVDSAKLQAISMFVSRTGSKIRPR